MSNCVRCNNQIVDKYSHAKYCSVKCGNAARSERWRQTGAEKLKRQTPRGKYHLHKTNAKLRGVDFNISFDEWWEIWKPHWSPDIHGKLCMCRNNDQGAYEVGNVRIDTWQNNIREARGLELLT